MTSTLTPDIEQALAEEAKGTGTSPEQLAVERLRTSLALRSPSQQLPGPTSEELALMDHASRVRAILGSMAYLGPSRLMEERPGEIAREERRWSQ